MKKNLIFLQENLMIFTRKFNTTKTMSKTLLRKVMLKLFFDISEPILVKWMPKGTTINAARYVDTHEVAHKHQKSAERKISCKSRVVA